jgi:uncharacterized protein
MIPRRRRGAMLAAAGLLAAAVALADRYDAAIPEKPQRYVTDRAGVFASGQAEALNARLEQFERETSDQVLVWVDRKLPEDFTLEDFTVRAAQKWGAGQKKEDNGAILFVFTEDRKARIEVGYGLEGPLPDVTAKRILEDEMFPKFRAGDFAGGIDAAAGAMMAAVKGEYRGSGRTNAERGQRRSNDMGSFGTCLIIGLVFILPLFFRRRSRWRTFGGGGWWTGGGFGGWGGGGGFGGFAGGGGSFGGGGASGSW